MATLTRQELERVAHRRCVPVPFETQGPDDALAGLEDTIPQEDAAIWLAGARAPAGVFHLNLKRESPGHHQEVSVHDRRAVVGDPIGVMLPLAATMFVAFPVVRVALNVGVDQLDLHVPGYVQELQAHVASRQRIIVVLRQAAQGPAVNGGPPV
jgi:hypothetical protein